MDQECKKCEQLQALNKVLTRQIDLLRQQLEIAQFKIDEEELRTKHQRELTAARQRRFIERRAKREAEQTRNRLNGVDDPSI